MPLASTRERRAYLRDAKRRSRERPAVHAREVLRNRAAERTRVKVAISREAHGLARDRSREEAMGLAAWIEEAIALHP